METHTNIKIAQSLFMDLCIYAIENADDSNPRYQRIEKGIQSKLDAIARRKLYSEYKTGETEDARRQARQKYLESVGIPSSFRWPSENDANVMRNAFSQPL